MAKEYWEDICKTIKQQMAGQYAEQLMVAEGEQELFWAKEYWEDICGTIIGDT